MPRLRRPWSSCLVLDFAEPPVVRLATGLATYPDAAVICGEITRDPASPTHVTNPSVLVEVLSQQLASCASTVKSQLRCRLVLTGKRSSPTTPTQIRELWTQLEGNEPPHVERLLLTLEAINLQVKEADKEIRQIVKPEDESPRTGNLRLTHPPLHSRGQLRDQRRQPSRLNRPFRTSPRRISTDDVRTSSPRARTQPALSCALRTVTWPATAPTMRGCLMIRGAGPEPRET